MNNYKILLIDEDKVFTSKMSKLLKNSEYSITILNDLNDNLNIFNNNLFDIIIISNLIYPYYLKNFANKLNINTYTILISNDKISDINLDNIQAIYQKNTDIQELIKLIQNQSILHDKLKNSLPSILLTSIAKEDLSTRMHSNRVAKYSVELGKYLNLSNEELEKLEMASLLHDIGKIEIPEKILNKEDKLTNEEYEIIKNHTILAENIISSEKIKYDVLPYIRHHHERIDGNGYPDKLKDEQIPYLSKIIAVCDTYDALTSNRCYRKGMKSDDALKILESVKGSQLDSTLVDKFTNMLKKSYTN